MAGLGTTAATVESRCRQAMIIHQGVDGLPRTHKAQQRMIHASISTVFGGGTTMVYRATAVIPMELSGFTLCRATSPPQIWRMVTIMLACIKESHLAEKPSPSTTYDRKILATAAEIQYRRMILISRDIEEFTLSHVTDLRIHEYIASRPARIVFRCGVRNARRKISRTKFPSMI